MKIIEEQPAAIILAAGGSKRFGQPKQLLDWFGKTFIEVAIDTALKSKLSPVIVVTGAHADQVEDQISSYPVIIARNSDWSKGQSSSLIKGVDELVKIEDKPFIFLLCDQPQVPVVLVKGLARKARLSKAKIVITEVGGRTQPPIYFHQACIEEIKKLEGDQGGKIILGKYKTAHFHWNDDRIGIDCDTPEDYKKMIDSFKKCV